MYKYEICFKNGKVIYISSIMNIEELSNALYTDENTHAVFKNGYALVCKDDISYIKEVK